MANPHRPPCTSCPTLCCPQVLPNGNRRVRGLPLSEKLLPGEAWQEAVVRGVVEELGPILPPNPQASVRCVGALPAPLPAPGLL